MKIIAIVRLALNRILASPTRSVLTMLGVIIGVASLVALISVVNGATSNITESLSGLGAKQVTVTGKNATALTEADAAALAELPNVAVTSTQASGQGTVATGNTAKTISLVGVSPSYVTTADPDIAAGRFLPSWSGAEASRTVVLSAEGADDLGLAASDIGSKLQIEGSSFTLIGILNDNNGFGNQGSAYVPLESARRLFAQAPYLSTITVMSDSTDSVSSVQDAIGAKLEGRYPVAKGEDPQYSVTNQSALIEAFNSARSTLSLLLIGTASISLIVGGIGIMNIMLVAVRERTIEIGVRRATGARRGQILTQFIIEAVILSLLGGLIGLGLGIALSAVIAQIGGWAFTVTAWSVALAVCFSALVGVAFGAWPARTAARMEPVVALRFE